MFSFCAARSSIISRCASNIRFEARTFSFFLRKRDRKPVMCTLAMDALENAAQTSDLSEPALNRIFDAHRLMIELRAAQKLNAGLLDADGSVPLGADDFPGLRALSSVC